MGNIRVTEKTKKYIQLWSPKYWQITIKGRIDAKSNRNERILLMATKITADDTHFAHFTKHQCKIHVVKWKYIVFFFLGLIECLFDLYHKSRTIITSMLPMFFYSFFSAIYSTLHSTIISFPLCENVCCLSKKMSNTTPRTKICRTCFWHE